MLSADFAREGGVDLPSLRAALGGVPYSVGTEEGLRTLHGGRARGIFYGGCLSILVALLGTPYEPQTEGKLLFLEDTGVKPYQVDGCSGNYGKRENWMGCGASCSARCTSAFRRARRRSCSKRRF